MDAMSGAIGDVPSALCAISADPGTEDWIRQFLEVPGMGLATYADTVVAQGITQRDHLCDLPTIDELVKAPWRMKVPEARRLHRYARAALVIMNKQFR